MLVGCSGVQTVTRVESIDYRILQERFLPACNDSRNIEILKCSLELEQGLCALNCRMRSLQKAYGQPENHIAEPKCVCEEQ